MSRKEMTLQESAALDKLLSGLPTLAPASAALKEQLEAISLLPQEGSRQGAPVAGKGPGYSILAALFGAGTTRSLIPQAAGLTMICLVGGVALGLSGFAAPPESAVTVDASAYFFGDPGLEKDLEELD